MKIPNKTDAAYWAGKTIHVRGPMDGEALYDVVDFGSRRATALKRIVESGWLVQLEGGRIDLGKQARDHYAGIKPDVQPKFAGSLATPRENLHAMEPLSSKHYLNVKGPRADAPDVRAYPSVYAKVTP